MNSGAPFCKPPSERSLTADSSGLAVIGWRGLLLCRVTGQNRWDLPKGTLEPGESPFDAALRETYEETGFDPAPLAHRIEYVGTRDFLPPKRLHVYRFIDPEGLVRAEDLSCLSMVCRPDGTCFPEADRFAWFTFEQALEAAGPALRQCLAFWQSSLDPLLVGPGAPKAKRHGGPA